MATIEQVKHEILETPVTVYNFEVEDYHTYYVTESSVLVHNKGCEAERIRAAAKKTRVNRRALGDEVEAYKISKGMRKGSTISYKKMVQLGRYIYKNYPKYRTK